MSKPDDLDNAPYTDDTLPPCPQCGGTLRVEDRLVTKPVGTFSLAGAQTKFAATSWPHLVCSGCTLAVPAKRT